jgi:hypothetical protein
LDIKLVKKLFDFDLLNYTENVIVKVSLHNLYILRNFKTKVKLLIGKIIVSKSYYIYIYIIIL